MTHQLASTIRRTVLRIAAGALMMCGLLALVASALDAQETRARGAPRLAAHWNDIARAAVQLAIEKHPDGSAKPTVVDRTRSQRGFARHSNEARSALSATAFASTGLASRAGEELYACADAVLLRKCTFSQPGRIAVLMPPFRISEDEVEIIVHILDAGPDDLGKENSYSRVGFNVVVSRDADGKWTKSRIKYLIAS